MGVTLTPYQTTFRTKLSGDFQGQFDEVVKLAQGSANVTAFAKVLPEGFASVVNGMPTIEAALSAVLAQADWGGQNYEPPKSTLAGKAKPAARAIAPMIAPAGAVAGAAVASKRRGNPEALKKAREARGLKTPEQTAADRQVVITSTVAYLKAHPGVQHIKPVVFALVEQLKTAGTNGTALSESFIYTTVTNESRVENCPFVPVDMEKRQRGYQLR